MSTETTDTIYVTASGKFVPVNKLTSVGAVRLDGRPMGVANWYTCTLRDGSSIHVGYEFLEDAYKCRAGLLRVWEAQGKTKKVSHITKASDMKTLAVPHVQSKQAVHEMRRTQVHVSLTEAIQQVLDKAVAKGDVTLSPVAVAGQVMPELVSVCWHYLSAHPSFSVCGENIMGEEFVSLPLNK